MLKNIFQQIYKNRQKALLQELKGIQNLIVFIESYKLKFNIDDIESFDKEDIREILGFMWKDRLVDEKQNFIKLGLNYINQPITFTNQKQAKIFLKNTNNILKQIHLLKDKPGWDLKTDISFKSEKENYEKYFSPICKEEINDMAQHPQPNTQSRTLQL